MGLPPLEFCAKLDGESWVAMIAAVKDGLSREATGCINFGEYKAEVDRADAFCPEIFFSNKFLSEDMFSSEVASTA